MEKSDPLALFNRREREVAERIARGDSGKQIAHELGIALGTVACLRAKAIEKAGARNSAHLGYLIGKAGA